MRWAETNCKTWLGVDATNNKELTYLCNLDQVPNHGFHLVFDYKYQNLIIQVVQHKIEPLWYEGFLPKIWVVRPCGSWYEFILVFPTCACSLVLFLDSMYFFPMTYYHSRVYEISISAPQESQDLHLPPWTYRRTLFAQQIFCQWGRQYFVWITMGQHLLTTSLPYWLTGSFWPTSAQVFNLWTFGTWKD